MSKILMVCVLAMSLLTISCNESEFSNEGSLLSKLENGNADQQNIDEASPTEDEKEAVVEVMEEDEVVDVEEPVKEVVEDEVMAEKYACNKKPLRLKVAKKKCKKKKKSEKASADDMEEHAADSDKRERRIASVKDRVMLCHVPKGNPTRAKTLCLPRQAIKAHLSGSMNSKLGYLGPCKKDI